MNKKVCLNELSWPEVKGALEGGTHTVLIMVGSTEQHGPHLPLMTDSLIGETLGKRIAEKLGNALVAPVISVGSSRHHMVFPGTITLSDETLICIAEDYCRSLAHHGFKNIFIIPTHGGNYRPLKDNEERIKKSAPEAKVVIFHDLPLFVDLLSNGAAKYGISREVAGVHASESETSAVLALRPELVTMARAQAGYIGPMEEAARRMMAEDTRKVTPNGVLGDPTKATAGKGQEYLADWVDFFADFIRKELQ